MGLAMAELQVNRRYGAEQNWPSLRDRRHYGRGGWHNQGECGQQIKQVMTTALCAPGAGISLWRSAFRGNGNRPSPFDQQSHRRGTFIRRVCWHQLRGMNRR
jgi:hypothetical protein